MDDDAQQVEPEVTEDTEAPQAGETDGDENGKDFDPNAMLEKIRKVNSENANLRKRAKAAEEKASGADEKDHRIAALEAENLRIRIGARHGLPDQIIDRLKGDSEEEILADAEALLKILAPNRPPTGKPAERLRGGGEPEAEPEETDVSKIGARMFRR